MTTLDLPKPTTDPEEFVARMEDVIDRHTSPGHQYAPPGRRNTELLLAVTRYQAQCFALLLHEARRPVFSVEGKPPWGLAAGLNGVLKTLDDEIHGT